MRFWLLAWLFSHWRLLFYVSNKIAPSLPHVAATIVNWIVIEQQWLQLLFSNGFNRFQFVVAVMTGRRGRPGKKWLEIVWVFWRMCQRFLSAHLGSVQDDVKTKKNSGKTCSAILENMDRSRWLWEDLLGSWCSYTTVQNGEQLKMREVGQKVRTPVGPWGAWRAQ